jgi:hypothetical protein
MHLVHQIPFIYERATITLENNSGMRINSSRKKKEIKVKAHSYF